MREQIEAWLSAFGFRATGGGATVSLLGWAFSSAAAAWCGAVVALCGLVLNTYFNRRRDRREQAEFEARMKALGHRP